jgi:AbrB family looped-hinge helix DNA binding protein
VSRRRADHTLRVFTVTVTSKGQITLPAVLRRRWRSVKGDLVEFTVTNGQFLMRLPHRRRAAARREAGHP